MDDASCYAGCTNGSDINKIIKNLSTFANLAEFEKSNLLKSKKSSLKAKISDFARANCFGTEFLTFKA